MEELAFPIPLFISYHYVLEEEKNLNFWAQGLSFCEDPPKDASSNLGQSTVYITELAFCQVLSYFLILFYSHCIIS